METGRGNVQIEMASPVILTGFVGSGSGTDAAVSLPDSANPTGARAGRRDGRAAGAMRAVSATQGSLLRADGSARLRVGLTDVLVSVYGPMECPVHRQLADRAEVYVTFRQPPNSATVSKSGARSSMPGEAVVARDLREIVLQSVLTALHPRKAIAVSVHVLADDGGAAAAAINAAYLALIDAGVNMQSVLTASSVAVHNGAVVVDPEGVEEAEADGVLTATFDAGNLDASADLVASHCSGAFGDYALFESAVKTARELAAKTRAFIQLSVEGKVSSSAAHH